MYNPLAKPDTTNLIKELKFKTSRSGGSGGQHVNKVETKVTLYFSIEDSDELTEEQKNRVKESLKLRVNKDGRLQLTSSKYTTQKRNKQDVIERFLLLLSVAFTPLKQRKQTKVPFKSKMKRLDNKKRNALRKDNRKKINL